MLIPCITPLLRRSELSQSNQHCSQRQGWHAVAQCKQNEAKDGSSTGCVHIEDEKLLLEWPIVQVADVVLDV